MKEYIDIEQLKKLPVNKLINYAKRLQVVIENEDNLNEERINEICTTLSSKSNLYNLINILGFPKMNYDEDYRTWMVDFGNKREGFEQRELIDALFEAVINRICL
jgi:hypothetical protein